MARGAKLKTTRNTRSVSAFLARQPAARRADCQAIVRIMRRATGARPAMWGTSIVGFGSYHYRYESGREGDWMLTGFSPRSRNLALYIMPGFGRYGDLLKRLGKHGTGKSCLYLKRLSDVDESVLAELVQASVDHLRSGRPDGQEAH
jgi:hypothetical protein